MPKTAQMLTTKLIRQEDIGKGLLMTVKGCEQRNVAQAGTEPDMKWCLLFREDERPLALNSTNIQLCERIFGSDDTDKWVDKQLVIYVDPNVSFGGRLVGGMRVRAPKPGTPPPPPLADHAAPEDDDSTPF